VRALFEVAGREPRRATCADLGFVAAPRLNAAGRLADMSLGIRCLVCPSPEKARALAAELDRLNRERRAVEQTMPEEALASLDGAAPDEQAYTICMHQPQWHAGVAGIVAARLKERFHRPAMVFATAGDGTLKGSGRSIGGFHLRDALDAVEKRAPGTLLRYGGHAFAAGASLVPDALPAFADAFEAHARAILAPEQLRRVHTSDGALARGELDYGLACRLRDAVWGQGLPAPSFDDRFEVAGQRVVGEHHRRLTLVRDEERFAGIAFRAPDALPGRIHALYRPEVREWNGLTSVELVVEHWEPDA
jgi:single-stranded-DNA-specific exonuclease